MSKLINVNLSSIETKIPKIAFGLFRFWTNETGLSKTIVIKSEQNLIEDLRNSLKKAIIALCKKEKIDEKPIGWDIGFVIGFLDGNLGKKWYHEYISKRSDDYKTFIGLKAVENYLTFDEISKIRIDRIYSHLIEEETNLENQLLEVRKLDLDEEQLEIYPKEEKGKVLAILHNLIMKQILVISEMDNRVELPIEKYLSNKEIRKLIDDNRM